MSAKVRTNPVLLHTGRRRHEVVISQLTLPSGLVAASTPPAIKEEAEAERSRSNGCEERRPVRDVNLKDEVRVFLRDELYGRWLCLHHVHRGHLRLESAAVKLRR